MFKYFGYENTKILEEGFEGWVKREYETSKLIKKPKKKIKIKISEKKKLIITKNLLLKILKITV